jgi:hypothetical protein
MRSLFLQAKRLIAVTAGDFATSEGVDNVWNGGGNRTGSLIMTVRRRTLLCHCSNFWPLKHDCGPPPSLLAWATLCDFILFPRMESQLKGYRFLDVSESQEQSLTVLHGISKCQFRRYFQQRRKRWNRFIN